MSKSFDEEFYTNDFDEQMLSFISNKYDVSTSGYCVDDNYLKYGIGNNYFWTSEYGFSDTMLTKEQFKQKIGMADIKNISFYEDIINKCKNTNTNLVITGEGVYVLDCINSVEYKVESTADYEDIINAVGLLKRKEINIVKV